MSVSETIWPYTQHFKTFRKEGLRYRDRHIITRDSQIDGGVFYLPKYEETIVVDEKTQPLLRHYASFTIGEIQRLSNGSSENLVKNALQTVNDVVRKVTKYDQMKIDALHAQWDIRPGNEVDLDFYLENNAGICRHQALFGGYLLECMIKRNFLQGAVSIDSNYIPGNIGHSWVRYTDSHGEVYVIDAANNFFGTMAEGISLNYWNYRRPEDT